NTSKISQIMVEDPHHKQQMGLAKWAHQKCGYLGEKATYRWAQDCGIVIIFDIIKTVIAQCPICQHTQQRTILHIVRGQLNRGKLPRQIWQMDCIGPLPAQLPETPGIGCNRASQLEVWAWMMIRWYLVMYFLISVLSMQ
uniref:Integrase zinc-binding domain-containing protein n=1 Tax=Strigops habroptila TaxID=2489341 RepID=A0A672TI29_STRHB